ncbi:MAG: hypothetical protein COB76_06870 [Alphaproteobacteria bacterium]|nr:MAG: hypothetical protein COB76_06870 [Alphaproteobacteria bacterium]
MQNRPLEIPVEESHFTTPFERFVFNNVAQSRSYYCYTEDPLFRANSLEGLLNQLGFDGVPNFNKNDQDHYPVNVPYPAHPKAYLKWGMERSRRNHVILELGELYYLVHFDIKNTQKNRWHIDQIVVRNGSSEYFIPCDDPDYKFLGEDLLSVVAQTVSALNKDRPYHVVADAFKKGVGGVLNSGNEIATEYGASLNEGRSKMPSDRFPFRP